MLHGLPNHQARHMPGLKPHQPLPKSADTAAHAGGERRRQLVQTAPVLPETTSPHRSMGAEAVPAGLKPMSSATVRPRSSATCCTVRCARRPSMVARALFSGFPLPSCFPKAFLMPASSSTTLTAPPAATQGSAQQLLWRMVWCCCSTCRHTPQLRRPVTCCASETPAPASRCPYGATQI